MVMDKTPLLEQTRSADMLDKSNNRSFKSKKKFAHKNAPHKNMGLDEKLYAAIDLGTNNCRLLIVTPEEKHFRVVDSFSRIVRLGEGLDVTGRLCEKAMERALAAIHICASKLRKYDIERLRCVATEACREAENGADFINRVGKETRLNFDIIGAKDEAELASVSCGNLFDRKKRNVIVLDIGGGSTEISYLRLERGRFELKQTKSFPLGVVRLAERYGGHRLTLENYHKMRAACIASVKEFVENQIEVKEIKDLSQTQMVVTSGTVTTLVAIQLGLKFYDRGRVDGSSVSLNAAQDVIKRLLAMSPEQLASQPCIGPERADLMLSGCAILESFLHFYPIPVLKVADRGLREGILLRLMRKDQRMKGGGHKRRNRVRLKKKFKEIT